MKINPTAGMVLTIVLAAAAPAAEPGPAGRLVHHAMAESVVPGRALRVVTLTYESTESALALGLVPLGAVNRKNEEDFYPQVAAALASTRPVGDENTPDLGAIAALHPDLILGVKLRHAALYARLSEIAPTVFCETLRGEWRNNFRLWATALGREQEAVEALADWTHRVASAKLRWPDAVRTRVTVLRFMPAGLRIYHDRSFAMSIILEVGCQPGEFRAANDFFEELPLARLGDLDSSDAIIWFTWDDATGAALQREQAVTASAAWAALRAVRERRSFRVDDGVWNTGGNLISARLLLDELVRLFASAGK